MIRPTLDRSIPIFHLSSSRPPKARATLLATALAGLVAAGAGCDSMSTCGTSLGAGGAGAGGAGGAGGQAAAAVGGCSDPDPGVVDYLDDMEDGNAMILGRDGRIGYWYTYHDPTAGTLNPDMGVDPVMEPIVGGRCGASAKAMRVTGSGFNDWGAGFAFSLKYMAGKEQPYDATRFSGITFWARIGETSTSQIQLGIGDQWSRPDGGHCTIEAGPMTCYDTFGTLMTFTTTWQRYTVRFAQMQQRSFGLPRAALDTTALMTVEFGIPPGAPVFDIWIDDVAFFQ